MTEQTDGQTAAGCTDDKANAVMNEFIYLSLHLYLFIYMHHNFIYLFIAFSEIWTRPGSIQSSVTYNTKPPLSAKKSAALRKSIRTESRCVMKPKPYFSKKISL